MYAHLTLQYNFSVLSFLPNTPPPPLSARLPGAASVSVCSPGQVERSWSPFLQEEGERGVAAHTQEPLLLSAKDKLTATHQM